MQLPTLFNLIIPPHGEEALKLGVQSRQTLLHDLSLLNITDSTNWDLRHSPHNNHQQGASDTASEGENSSNSGSGSGGKRNSRKLLGPGEILYTTP
jgi:hypothetical protein